VNRGNFRSGMGWDERSGTYYIRVKAVSFLNPACHRRRAGRVYPSPRAYLLRFSNVLENLAVGLLRQYSRTLSVMAAFLSRSSVVRFALPLM
jgi:hypothetical protein